MDKRLVVNKDLFEALNILIKQKPMHSKEELVDMHAESINEEGWYGAKFDYLNYLSIGKFAQAIYNGYRLEYGEIEEGDIVISAKDPHSCDIRIVECADKECILLVNGHRDLHYNIPEDLDDFWDTWKILCKKEDRKDI